MAKINFFSFDFSKVSKSSSYDHPKKTNSYKERKKFGSQVHWVENRHYDPKQLEKHRMVGDIQVDTLLDLMNSAQRKGRNAVTNDTVCMRKGGSSSSSSSDAGSSDTSNDIDSSSSPSPIPSSFRFLDVVDACAKLYEEKQQSDHKNNNKSNCYVSNQANQASSFNEVDQAMIQFYSHYYNNTPDWVDWDQLQNGIDVFITFSPQIGQCRFYLSLVPGFSIPKIAQVLQQTKYLAPPSTNEQVQRRLFDTGGFITSCMIQDSNAGLVSDGNNDDINVDDKMLISASSLRPGNMGWNMALRVRVLHAKVRRLILNSKKNGTGTNEKWDIKEYGVPINQEDLAATLLAFSVNPLKGIEFIAGKSLSKQEEMDYLALWRYIGWLLGVSSYTYTSTSTCTSTSTSTSIQEDRIQETLLPLDPLSCGADPNADPENVLIRSNAMLESIIFHLMHPDELSSTISNHLLRVGRSPGKDNKFQPTSGNKSKTHTRTHTTYNSNINLSFGYLYRSFMCRRFIGDELGDALKIPKVSYRSLKHIAAYQLTMIILILLRLYTLLTMSSTWFRHRAYKRHLNLMNKFYLIWSKENGKRMKSIKTSTNSSRKISVSEPTNSSSCCPFSLVMPPPSTKQNNALLDSKKSN